jgi:hypothetical protein
VEQQHALREPRQNLARALQARQEEVASAQEQYVSSLSKSYNYAKISLVRAPGIGEQGVKEYFRGK